MAHHQFRLHYHTQRHPVILANTKNFLFKQFPAGRPESHDPGNAALFKTKKRRWNYPCVHYVLQHTHLFFNLLPITYTLHHKLPKYLRVQPIKNVPNLINPIPRIHRHLQQDPRLLRVQPAARDHVILDVLLRHEAVHRAPARDHRGARLVEHPAGGLLDGIVDAARAAARENEALGAGLDRRGNEGGNVVLVGVDDGDGGEGGGVGGGREEGLVGDGAAGVEEVRDLVDEEAELPLLGGEEGVEAVGVVLGGVEGVADAAVWFCQFLWRMEGERGRKLLVQRDHDAAAARLLAGGQADGLVQVERAVGAEGGGGAHGADDDDGLGRVEDEVEVEGRLLERVGAVRHDDAGHVVLLELLGDVARQRQQDRRVDVLAADVGDLLAVDVRDVEDLRNRVDELLHAQADLVADGLR